MDRNLTYAKTPSGEEATRQRTRVVQRNLRMVLLQVDGQMSVDELIAKIGNESLVINALKELEKGGYVCLAVDAPSVWEQSKARVKAAVRVKDTSNSPISAASNLSAASDFSDFGQLSDGSPSVLPANQFSAFGKPLPKEPELPPLVVKPQAVPFLDVLKQRLQSIFAKPDLDDEQRADLKPYKKVNVVQTALWVVVAAFVAFVGIVLLFPYDSYRDDLEKALSAAFATEVRIGQVDAAFYPAPSLLLKQVKIGRAGDSRIAEIRIPQLFSLRGKAPKVITELVLSDATFNADSLAQLEALGAGLANGGAGFQLQHVKIANLSLVMGGASLHALKGDASFKAGRIEKIELSNEDRTLRFSLLPGQGTTNVTLEAIAWKPGGEEKSIAFQSLQAKGTLQTGKLFLNDVDANVFSGTVLGNWTLEWTNGLSVSGDAQLTRLNLRQLSTGLGANVELDGDLSGILRFRGAADSWEALWGNMEASLGMSLGRGTVGGVDLGEASRRGVGSVVRGGSTKFQQLTGNVKISPQAISSADLDMDAGLVRATGQFVMRRPDASVDAGLVVSINSSVSPIKMPVKIYGKLPTLETVVGR